MTLRRRQLGLAAGGVLLAGQARSQGKFPERPIRVVVPFGPGSAVDVSMRLVAPKMGESLGQPLIVENKAGATGAIGSGQVARAPANGYALVMGTVASHATLAATQPDLPYDIQRDFTPIGLVTNSWTILVITPAIPAKNIEEFVAYTTRQPKPVNYASGGVGGVTHLAAELFRLKTGANVNHIPYRDAAQGIADTIGGHVEMMVYPSAVVSHIQAGTLRGLAVFGPKRLEALPDLPTAAEQGYPDLLASGWQGLFGPAKLPDAIRDRIATAIRDAVSDPEVRGKLVSQGFDPDADSTPATFAQFVAAEIAKWKQVVNSPGVQVQ